MLHQVFTYSISILFCFLFSAYGFAADFSVTQSVHDKDNRYSIEFPTNWEISSGKDLGVDLIAKAPTAGEGANFIENANVVSQVLDQSITSQQYFEIGLPELKTFNGFKLGKIIDTTINGQKAVQVEYSYLLGDQELKVLQYIVVKDKLAIVVTFGADPIDYLSTRPLYETIANSLMIK